MTALDCESLRRSFFLFIITVRYSPCDLKGDVDCPAKQREQQYDLFKRHDASPLPALKRPGRNEISKKKFALARHLGTGKEYSRLRLWAQRLMDGLRRQSQHTIKLQVCL